MKLTWTALYLIMTFAVSAQNLVPNSNMENFDSCPMFISDFTLSDWIVPTTATSDYYNECGAAEVGVPSNLIGFQASSAGAGYAGLVTYELGTGYREYIQIPLTTPTVAGSCYQLSIIYSPADEAGFSNGLGMLLSNGTPSSYIGQNPQLMKTEVSESDEVWHNLTINYVSPGDETHVTIGNFNNDANTTFQSASGAFGSIYGYYYIDSVAVVLSGSESTEISVDLGADMLVCDSDFPVTITSSLPDATNIWSTGESGTSISVNSGGIYYVQSFLSCAYAVDSIEISVIEDPSIEIDDETLCEGSSYLIELDASLGDYLWDDGSEEASFEVTEPGSYAVTLTHECGDIVEMFDVDVLMPIDIPEPINLQLCESELPYVVDFIELNDGINQFLWQDGSSAPGIIINTDGTYAVEIYNDCFSDMVDFEVEISAQYPPFVNFTDTIKCIGEQVVIDPGFVGVDFLWQDGSTLPYFLAPGPGEYSVIVSNFCGTDQFDFTIVEAVELIIDLGDDVSICPGDSTLITAFVGGTSISWSNGSSGNSTWATEDGQLIATAAGLCGPISDTVNIFFNGMAPVIDVPDSLLVCIGDTISLSASDDISGIDFSWNTGEDGASISIYDGGTYVVSGENSCGIVIDSVIVTLGESLPDPILEDIYEICAGDTIDLQIETNGGAVLWSTGSIDSSVQIYQEGSYFVSLTNSCTTKEDSFVLVFTQELSPLNLGPDFGICEGDSMTIDAGTFNGEYDWSTESEEQLITIYEVGLYSLQINGECNSIYDTVEVTSLGTNPLIDLGADVTFCDGDSVVVHIGTAIVDEVLWNTGATENSITIFTAGTYIVVGNNICGTDEDTIVAEINNEVPQIDLGDDQQICPGDSVTLDLGNVAGQIIWNTGDEGASIEVFEDGEYFAVLTSSCGSSADSVIVEILEAAPEVDLGDDQILCFGETLDFDLLVGIETTIEWNDGVTNSENSFQESGLIWVALNNACGEVIDSLNL
ncbi:hypothetical protein N9B82_06110, partial [Saprospiraceae bacterium]|nr:hypothetical protein [Saprospiraceae bacterium]